MHNGLFELSGGGNILNRFWLSLCESFSPALLDNVTAEKRDVAVNQVTGFVTSQLAVLPIILRICLFMGLLVFQIFVLTTTFCPFQWHSLKTRRTIVEAWAFGPVALARQLFRPIRSLTIFAFFENPIVLEMLRQKIRTVNSIEKITRTNDFNPRMTLAGSGGGSD